jgi:hypothetical protein
VEIDGIGRLTTGSIGPPPGRQVILNCKIVNSLLGLRSLLTS